jgi:hypothetical protein
MQAVIDRLRKEGYPLREEDIIHLAPARHEHINFYGKYSKERGSGGKLIVGVKVQFFLNDTLTPICRQ